MLRIRSKKVYIDEKFVPAVIEIDNGKIVGIKDYDDEYDDDSDEESDDDFYDDLEDFFPKRSNSRSNGFGYFG